jgi:hypothetical protein
MYQSFDMAVYAGHKAFDELFKVYSLYVQPLHIILEHYGVHIQAYNFDPESKIHTLSRQLNVQQLGNLDLETISPVDGKHFWDYLMALRELEVKFCINTSIYFQIMMEVEINDVSRSQSISNSNWRSLSFADKWTYYMNHYNASETELDYFDNYCEQIYRKLRNKSVHAAQRYGIRNVELFKFSHVHQYLKQGWFVGVFLINKEEGFSLDYEGNWKQMAEIYHHIPASINSADFPDMSELAKPFFKKFSDFYHIGS